MDLRAMSLWKPICILGKLIPAGTGMKRYQNIKLNTDYNKVVVEAVKEAAPVEEIVDDEEFEEAE